MFARHRSWLSLCVVLGASACKSEDPTQGVCELLLTCPCTAPPYATVDDCVSSLNTQADVLKSYADGVGLTFDRGCYEQSYEQIQDQAGCGTEFSESGATCSYCAIIHGDKKAGSACTSTGGFGDCAANLICADGVCVDICAALGAGDVCATIDGEGGTTIRSCGAGLYCDSADTLTCKAQQSAGETCDPFSDTCKEGLVCGSTSTCGPPPAAGEACTSECAGDLVCENNICAVPPGESEPCTANGECAEGFECGDINSCVAQEPLLCQILGNGGF